MDRAQQPQQKLQGGRGRGKLQSRVQKALCYVEKRSEKASLESFLTTSTE